MHHLWSMVYSSLGSVSSVPVHVEGLFGVAVSSCYRGKFVVIVPFVSRRDDIVAVFIGGVDFGGCFIVWILSFGAWVVHIIWV